MLLFIIGQNSLLCDKATFIDRRKKYYECHYALSLITIFNVILNTDFLLSIAMTFSQAFLPSNYWYETGYSSTLKAPENRQQNLKSAKFQKNLSKQYHMEILTLLHSEQPKLNATEWLKNMGQTV